MQAVIVYNPKSGSALPKHRLKSLFKDSGVEIVKFIDVTDSFEKHISRYVNQTKIVVIGYGGDGTLNSVASQLIGTDTVFAPLPGGTLNHFTKDLGITQELQEAIQRLPKATVRKIDTAMVNGNLFLNNSSIGLYPSSLAERSKLESRLGKWPAAVIASFRAFIRFRVYSATIAGNTYRTPFIFVGNNHYEIDSLMERKDLDKGILSVSMIDSNKRSALLKIALLTLIGRAQTAREFTSFTTEKLTIAINKRVVRVSFDGEHRRLDAPIEYAINKKSLKVLI